MKKLVLACMVLFVVAALTAPAQALPICFKWTQFCDGVQVNNQGIGGASWYHWDCASNSPMDASKNGAWLNDGCAGPIGSRVLRSKSPNGPGDYYFVVDAPLDGTLDMYQGTYPNGACWIPNLSYQLLMGVCVGDGPKGAKPQTSTVQ